ncbi:MAG: xylulose kinase [Chloroflexia bacterium]|nr:xylulose kinase [Chloroflexia bacterium]
MGSATGGARDLVLGIDCSTTASKAVAWDRSGRAVAEGRAPLALHSPVPGWGEQHPADWWEATVGAIRGVVERIDARRIAALCVTHQRETFVPVREDGTPLRNAILWLDERSRPQLAALDRIVGNAALHRLTGRPPSMTQSLPKLLWLVEHEPETILGADRIVEVHAWLVHALTGEWRTSLASADPTGCVDMANGVWADGLIREIGLRPEQFVPFSAPGERLGAVSAAAAAATGLPVGLPVVAGAGDGQAACLGAGVVAPGRAYVNLGTAIAGGVVADRYLTDLAYRTCCGAVPGTFVLESVLRGGTATVSWFMDHVADPTIGSDLDRFAAYEALARDLPPGSDGLMLVPYWNNVMNPYWDPTATGLVLGWTVAHRRHHLYRAILEGIACEHRLAIEAIAASSGVPVSEHVVLGGGARSPLWRQIVADVLGAPVALARSADATNLGAGVLAAYGAGWYPTVPAAAAAMTGTTERHEPDPVTASIYDALFHEVYVGLFPAIRPLMNRLTELTEDRRSG